ncbi:T9SS type A sorting domain-containing protein [Epilithonimonas xixisoli]|uniref:Putative secreted protein (Por secretion system target) n=1 Tax=Epilithonimonas xixisoli TaxID=1476462 RepID=A0A4R8IHC9_9FLAO|nr:T9SS type A sorting domain-containing protein [Epilithonimonas xixisoli]TDX84894.1 putative secreted protein (Por secretion system target) [Epilithonimonas xixisoli]
MKKHFLFIFAILIYNLGFGQNNPVQNLAWYHTHIFPYNNIFSLSWAPPATPHNDLIGYNIYRGNELYRFQTNTSLGCDSRSGINDGCDFLTHAFIVNVKAVYEGNIESDAVSYTINGPALGTKEFSSKSFTTFPNPVKDILNFSEEITDFKITDSSGKIIEQMSSSGKSINVSKLTKGTYIFSATTKSGEIINKKFIKE